MTQLGFLRVSLNPPLANTVISAAEAMALMRQMLDDPRHRYLEAVPAPATAPHAFRHVLGHRQVTEAYLVWFAQHHRATFLTLDAGLRSFKNVEILT